MLSQTYQMSTDLGRARRAGRSREPAALADAPAPDGCRGAARLAPGRERTARPDDGRDAARPVAVPGPVRHRRRSQARRSTSRPGGASIFPCSAAPSTTSFQAFDFPDPAVPNGDRADDDGRLAGALHDERPDRGPASERLAEILLSRRESQRPRPPRAGLPAHPRPAGRGGGAVASGRRSSSVIRPRRRWPARAARTPTAPGLAGALPGPAVVQRVCLRQLMRLRAEGADR